MTVALAALIDRILQPSSKLAAARRHLGGTLILYDVTSSYLEERCCPLAAFGHNRDGKKGKKQIVFGLLCAADGCPVAVEVFAGHTADPRTVGPQIAKIRERFQIERVALVGDRGLLTSARRIRACAPTRSVRPSPRIGPEPRPPPGRRRKAGPCTVSRRCSPT